MAGTRILIDIRKHRGDSSFAVELVCCFSARYPGATREWLVRPDQARLIPSETVIGTADEFDRSWGPRLRDRLVQSTQADQGATGGAFLVLSYDNLLLSDVKTPTAPGLLVKAIHISELFKLGLHKDPSVRQIRPVIGVGGHPQPPRRGWDGPRSAGRTLFLNFGQEQPGSRLTLEEAEDLAKQVFRNGSHLSPDCGLPQKDLRPRMSALDPRAARRFGDPTSESLITTLVDIGLQQGWLKRFRRVPGRTGTEMLYFVEGVGQLNRTAASESISITAPAKATSETSQGPIAERPGTHEQNPEPADGKRPKYPNRATDFEAFLSKSRIGAMPESRERAFEAVAAIITENKGPALPLLELFARAIARAKESSEREGYIVEKNWSVVQVCIKRLMLWAGVLLDQNGEAISDKIGSNAKEVTALAPDFRRICEAYLVEHLIEKSGGINYDDETYYLGLTIYRRGIERAVPADELRAKADSILAFLEDNGRIYLDANRILRVNNARGRTLAVAG
jgi:hypothetical protein